MGCISKNYTLTILFAWQTIESDMLVSVNLLLGSFFVRYCTSCQLCAVCQIDLSLLNFQNLSQPRGSVRIDNGQQRHSRLIWLLRVKKRSFDRWRMQNSVHTSSFHEKTSQRGHIVVIYF